MLSGIMFSSARDLYAGFVSGSLALILDLALFICLLLLDKTAAWVLVPYLIYQLYAVSLGYELWKMNRSLS
jgi:tryptophan-rich sensory protein